VKLFYIHFCTYNILAVFKSNSAEHINTINHNDNNN